MCQKNILQFLVQAAREMFDQMHSSYCQLKILNQLLWALVKKKKKWLRNRVPSNLQLTQVTLVLLTLTAYAVICYQSKQTVLVELPPMHKFKGFFKYFLFLTDFANVMFLSNRGSIINITMRRGCSLKLISALSLEASLCFQRL